MSHFNLGVLVYAANKKDARCQVDAQFTEACCGDRQDFDYCQISKVWEVGTDVCSDELKKRMGWTKNHFMTALREIRGMINKSDEELWNQPCGDWPSFKYACNKAGKYDGYNIYLYDKDMGGIWNEQGLKDAIADTGGVGRKLYLVEVDAHG
jgi:hypothetical protein